MERPSTRSERISAALFVVILISINAYICRGLFTIQMAPMQSMHGFWAAIAEHAGSSWFQPHWWPFWDAGIPFEFTYAPLVPALTAVISAAFHISAVFAFQYLTAVCYCLAPATLFFVAWRLTGALSYSFLAGLFYSLISPTQVIVPDGHFSWRIALDARRLQLMTEWDDTPHVLALIFVLLAILFLTRSIQKRKPIYYAAAALSIALASYASAFGPIVTAMVAVCLLLVLSRKQWKRNLILIAGIGAYAYALSAHFLPPSALWAMKVSARNGEPGNWSAGSALALLIVVAGCLIIWRVIPRWTSDWRLQFFALFAYITIAIPTLAAYAGIHFLPQPGRYDFEMEIAVALFVVFAARELLARSPQQFKLALLAACLLFAASQVKLQRRFAVGLIRPGQIQNTIEYRAAVWAHQNLPGVRVSLPGSIAQWADAFTPIRQFSGGSWSMAYNQMLQRGAYAQREAWITAPLDARYGLDWLKAYGVGAVCVDGPNSPEYWKRFTHPAKFEGLLPVLWRSDDTTIYRVPLSSQSLAHVVPPAALVKDPPRWASDVSEIERYDAALDDPALPLADFHWQGRDAIHIRTTAQPGQVISIQVNDHPGWHAASEGHSVPIHKDALGLMWIDPHCNGRCEIQLNYDGGWELRLCRWLTYLALAVLIAGLAYQFTKFDMLQRIWRRPR